MCRFFAVCSTKRVSVAPYLRDLPNSLLHQSHVRPDRQQADGWGVGFFAGGRPRVIKSPRPIYQETASLINRAANANGSVLLGHIRRASNPKKIKKRRLIGHPHTQPFTHGPWLFVHNGTLNIPDQVRRRLGALAAHVKGRNDSEVLFYWILKTVVNGRGSLRQRVRRSVIDLEKMSVDSFYGLNWVLTNGQELMAFCYVRRDGFGKQRGLGHAGRYWQMAASLSSQRCVIASEPLSARLKWRRLRHGELLYVRRGKKRLNARRFSLR